MTRCSCCGQETDIPLIFPRMCQRVFAYIWDNPNCNAAEIQNEMWGEEGPNRTNALSNHIKAIRLGLAGTGYRLDRNLGGPQNPKRCGAKFRYRIMPVQPLYELHRADGVRNEA